jgi:hypothetical protein
MKNVLLLFAFCLLLLPADSTSARAFNEPFDSFDIHGCEWLINHLDNFAYETSYFKGEVGYIFVYGGKEVRAGETQMYMERITGYLVKRRGVSADKFRVVFGGYREHPHVTMIIVPPSVAVPDPAPTVEAKDVKFKKERVGDSEFGCAKVR